MDNQSNATPHARTTAHVHRARDGDAASLSWVIARFTPLLRAQARYHVAKSLAGVVDPDDLVQDVWIRTIPRLQSIESPPDGRLTPVLVRFLSTVLLNEYRNLLQKHVRGKPLRVGDTEGLQDLAAEQRGVVSDVVRGEVRDEVLGCIEELEANDRSILILRGIEQAPNQDVANLLGLRPNTVAARYRRALQRLRERLPGSIFEELVG